MEIALTERVAEKSIHASIRLLNSAIDFLVLILMKCFFLLQIKICSFLLKTKFHLFGNGRLINTLTPANSHWLGESWPFSTWAQSPKYALLQPLRHPNSTELTITRWVFDELCQAVSPASTHRAKHQFASCLNHFCSQGFIATMCNLLRASQAFFILTKIKGFWKFMQSHECIWYCITGKFFQANNRSSHRRASIPGEQKKQM